MVLLTAGIASGAQTFVLHGLTNVTIGNAAYDTNYSYYYGEVFHNLSSNGTDGVSIHLGEADSGLFVYPTTEGDPVPGTFMTGQVYGSVNGEADRLICRMHCYEEADGIHPLQIDFSALGVTQFTYYAFHRGRLVATSRPQPGSMVVYGNWFYPLYPRVNPFWRMADGRIGALLEFMNLESYTGWDPNEANLQVPGIGDVRADRLFIRAEGTTNVVDFTSRLDVTAGGGLPWFDIYDARLGVFRRGHKALPDTLLKAQGGRLTLAAATNESPGVAIELEPMSGFDVTFVPIEFATNAALIVTGIGRTSESDGTLGEGRIARTENGLQVSADLDLARGTNAHIVVYRAGAEVRRAAGTNASVPAATQLVGVGLQGRTPGRQAQIRFRFDQSVPVVLPDETSTDGDEVRFLAANDADFFLLRTVVLSATGLPSFTITAETEQPLVRPELTIRRVGRQYELSWVDPNRFFRLEGTRSLSQRFTAVELRPSYNGDVASLLVGSASAGNAFYRLSADTLAIVD